MLHQASETSSASESTASFGYADHAKQWAKGGVLLFGLGALGALGYRFLGWFSSNLHSETLSDQSVNAQYASHPRVSIEELDGDGNPVLQSAITYRPDADIKHQVSTIYTADRTTITNHLVPTTVLSRHANEALGARTLIPAAGASVTDFKSFSANELYVGDDLTLEYRENGDKINCETNILSTKDESVSSVNCVNAMVFGLVGSLITRNPFYLGAASLLCTQGAYGQIVNGQISNKLINVDDSFYLKINITELFGEPVTNIMIGQADGSGLPDWLIAGPTMVGGIATTNAVRVAVNGTLAYVADSTGGLKIIDVSNATLPVLKGSFATTNAAGVVISDNLAYVADGAGGLKIIDVSNSTQPVLKGSFATTNAVGVAVNGTLAYVSDYLGGLKIIDVSNATQPVLKGNFVAGRVFEVAINGNLAYVADWNGGLKIIDVSNATQPVLKGSFATASAIGVAIIDILAYVADDVGGLKIVDVSNVTQPILRGSLATTDAGEVVVIGGLAYVADSNGGLKIIDVSNSTQPVLKGSFAANSAAGVTVSGNLAYVAGNNGGLKIIDLISFWEISGVPMLSKQKYNILVSAKNCLLQTVKKSFFISTDYFPIATSTIASQSVMPGKSLTLPLDAVTLFKDIDIGDNLGLEIMLNNNTDSLPEFIQFKLKSFIRGSLSTPKAVGVDISDNLAYVADYVEGLKIIDVRDATKPILKGSYPTPKAMGVAISGNIAYVANWNGGLKIIDVSDVTHTILRGIYPLTQAQDVTIDASIAYVADGNGGVKIIDVSNATQPVLRGHFTTTDAVRIAISGNIAYVADGNGGLKIIDVSNLTQPVLRGNFTTTDAVGVAISGNLAYVADFWGGLRIIDVSNAVNPFLRGSLATTRAVGVEVSGNLAYVADWNGGLRIIDVSNVTQPVLIGSLTTITAQEIAISGNLAYVVDWPGGLKIIDLSNYQIIANPTFYDERNYEVVVSATDPLFATAKTSFVLRVEGAPRLMHGISQQYASVGQEFYYFIPSDTFWDPNSDALTYSNTTPLPSFLTFNSIGVTFSGIPDYIDRGPHNITISVDDGHGGKNETSFNLLVTVPPAVVNPIPDQPVDIDKFFTLPITVGEKGNFNAMGEDRLNFKAMLTSQEPLDACWLKFNNENNIFSGIPKKNEKISVLVIATNQYGGKIHDEFVLTSEYFPKQIKTFTSIYAAYDHMFIYELGNNYFNDTEDDANLLTYSASQANGDDPLPPWLTFKSHTRIFEGIPSYPSHLKPKLNINITVLDKDGGSSSATFMLILDKYENVINWYNSSLEIIENQPPKCRFKLQPHPIFDTESMDILYSDAFEDPEKDPLNYSFNLREGESWIHVNYATKNLECRPEWSFWGTKKDSKFFEDTSFIINMVAIDPGGLSVHCPMEITLKAHIEPEPFIGWTTLALTIATTIYECFQQRHLFWNWCKKSKYIKSDLQLEVGRAGATYQIDYPSEKIKLIAVTTIKDGRCLKRESRCFNTFKNAEERVFPGGAKVYVFDWLLYDPKKNSFQVVEGGPREEFIYQKIEVEIIGTDERIMEKFNIKVVSNAASNTFDLLSDGSTAAALEQKQFPIEQPLSATQSLAVASTSVSDSTANLTEDYSNLGDWEMVVRRPLRAIAVEAQTNSNSKLAVNQGSSSQAQLLSTVGLLSSTSAHASEHQIAIEQNTAVILASSAIPALRTPLLTASMGGSSTS